MKQSILSFLLLLFCSAILAQQPPVNVDLVGHLSYSVNLSDIWGYQDTSGNEWALVGRKDGLSIVTLSDPANPIESFYIPGEESTWRDIKTWDHHAYVSNETGGGLLIVDLSHLPDTVYAKDTIIDSLTTAHNLFIDEKGFLYATGADRDSAGLSIFDLRGDPWNPVKAGAYTSAYVHDAYVRNDTAYNGEIYEGALTIVDVSDKLSPTILGSVTWANSFTHNTWLSDNGRVCFTTDELAEAYIYAWDVSDPTNIKELDRIRSSVSNGMAIPHNTHVKNNFLVTSYYKDGVNIVDANRPGNLVEVGYYDTHPEEGGGFNGAWGAYPFLPSGLLIVSDISTGLYVLQPDYKRASYLEGMITDEATSAPVGGTEISIFSEQTETRSDPGGSYALGIADTGVYTVNALKYGYLPYTSDQTFQPGQVTIHNIELTPAPVVPFSIQVLDAITQAPIGNAEIYFNSIGKEFKGITDENGFYSAADFYEGSYQIRVGIWGYKVLVANTYVSASNDSLIVELDRGYHDDFELDLGWETSGTASAGKWVRDEPIGTWFSAGWANPDSDAVDDYGARCYMTGNGGGSIANDQVTIGNVVLTSPPITTSTYISPKLVFDNWFVTIGNHDSTGTNDSLQVLFLNENSGETTILWSLKDTIHNYWSTDTVDLSQVAARASSFRIIFRVNDSTPPNYVEAAIDRFRIIDTEEVQEPELPDDFPIIYPNPFSEEFRIMLPETTQPPANVEILDLSGRTLVVKQMSATRETIGMGNLPSGAYIIRVWLSGDESWQTKLIKYE